MSNEGSAPSLGLEDAFANNEAYRELVTPLDQPGVFQDILDAQFYIRNDGLIVNAEGWHHPNGQLVGEAMYTPDDEGDRVIFGLRYKKLTLFPGTHTPVPYADRARLLRAVDPELDQTTTNPYFARYKQILPQDTFNGFISSEIAYQRLTSSSVPNVELVAEDIESISELIGVDISDVRLGFTGAPSLGNLDNLHDLDIVFTGSLEENILIARAMRRLLADNPQRRLTEGGKDWNIRFYNDRSTLICSFFRYQKPDEAPLREFSMEIIEPEVTLVATVSDDMHTIYTPTVLGLEDAYLVGEDRKLPQDMQLIVYHTATRGECFEGDRVMASGALVNVSTPTSDTLALCVIEREGVRNLTPTWDNFYQKGDI